ncbi:hypothetical protein Nit79A3_2367 [Nitrosomonas sp. Is79A3]|uniref:DUF4124 domain-containing protein n=1 Tax=Nitrosomonas sp. (strain Is79A3) TaxID=261292 RepID=UPI000215C966
MKRNNFLFIALILFSCLAQAGVYKHIDERGNVTYSNIPSSNSKKIDLPPIVVVPSTDSGDIDDRIIKRRENARIEEQREQMQSKISEEENRLNEVKSEYKEGIPDRLGSERNYQRYLNRVERLREEISVREKNLNMLRNELEKLPGKSN